MKIYYHPSHLTSISLSFSWPFKKKIYIVNIKSAIFITSRISQHFRLSCLFTSLYFICIHESARETRCSSYYTYLNLHKLWNFSAPPIKPGCCWSVPEAANISNSFSIWFKELVPKIARSGKQTILYYTI